ncbi:uncharacterized protein TRAVEDRAFT_29249 [Trametes versicolor FP-101664 SS1]|uniref:uncharacterized protein n=1 Tax=Trametes versicolor (strain FP-101664) TaxID=717944 RepID=UPI0004623B14|nr:uncharacterized protein TRAVEDRAFT_29249 [Trametes versicolor FP-101664 SS1]EIW58769.1 hypothetical protein TRAVEDRAFT_29249 [Trametes versicolor FP-101664 SS1]
MSSGSNGEPSRRSKSTESSDLSSSHEQEHTPSWEPRTLCVALESASRRASLQERQIKDLESKLALDLSNSRAIENLLQEVFTSINQTNERARFASHNTVPHIEQTLDEDFAVLEELEEQLPEVGSQIRDIRKVYDRGRVKACELMSSLEWLNTPLSQKLRTIIFTPNAPISNRWKVAVRSIFALVFCACLWIAWITLRGAIRAHQKRLVWGERLMS